MSESDPSDVVIALCTCPDPESADQIANDLVSEKLAACVTQIPGVRSFYVWDGEAQVDEEIQLVIKTTSSKLATVEERIKALHSYEVPELVALPACGGSQSYLDWVRKSCS